MVNAKIIKRCKAKDQKAFRKLYETCLPYVYTIVREHIFQDDFRRDVIQEVFAQVFLHISEYDSRKGEFRPWLRRLAINRCLMFLRDKKPSFEYEPLENFQEPSTEEQETLSDEGLDPNKIKRLLQTMPEGYRKVFELVVLEGYTHEEVAGIMDISTKSSRSQLSRARKWLRNHIKENKLSVRYGYL